jgi:hypothetical protein
VKAGWKMAFPGRIFLLGKMKEKRRVRQWESREPEQEIILKFFIGAADRNLEVGFP